jgi:hypothetical protein
VVDGRCKVKQYDGRGEETRTDKKSSVSVPRCTHDDKWSSAEGGDQPYSMANTVRDFFPLRLLTLGPRKEYAHASSF